MDEFAATVVLDERTTATGKAPKAAGETPKGHSAHHIEAALRRDMRR